MRKSFLTNFKNFYKGPMLVNCFSLVFKSLHSTESALLKVFNSSFVPRIVDSGNCAFLILLDLTAAFDTVDHTILLSRLEHDVGS